MYDPERGYPPIVPCLLYDDPLAAAGWLGPVLGLREVVRAELPDGWVGHVEVALDGFVVLLGRRGGLLADTAGLTQVFVPDVDEACRLAVTHGGRVLSEPEDLPWGVRQAVLADPEGQRWAPSRHLRDVEPERWYGQVVG